MKSRLEPRLKRAVIEWVSVSAIAAAMFGAGCAHSDRLLGLVRAPTVPALLNGPVAALLTNMAGFSGHAVMESGGAAQPVQRISGELMGREGMLLFVPDDSGSEGKRARAAGLSYIWNVTENRGYVLSEALQGYAPVAENVRFASIPAGISKRAPEKLDGHPCQQTEASVSSSDGSTVMFQLWQATDLNELPIRLVCTSNSTPITVSLSRIRPEAPRRELFQPPDGFTKFDSSETLMAEFVMRQQNLKRKPSGNLGDMERSAGPAPPQYRY
jgi:hypothetical protein